MPKPELSLDSKRVPRITHTARLIGVSPEGKSLCFISVDYDELWGDIIDWEGTEFKMAVEVLG